MSRLALRGRGLNPLHFRRSDERLHKTFCLRFLGLFPGMAAHTPILGRPDPPKRKSRRRGYTPREGWCSGQESNLHAFRHMPLKHACLPIPPPEPGRKKAAMRRWARRGCKAPKWKTAIPARTVSFSGSLGGTPFVSSAVHAWWTLENESPRRSRAEKRLRCLRGRGHCGDYHPTTGPSQASDHQPAISLRIYSTQTPRGCDRLPWTTRQRTRRPVRTSTKST